MPRFSNNERVWRWGFQSNVRKREMAKGVETVKRGAIVTILGQGQCEV